MKKFWKNNKGKVFIGAIVIALIAFTFLVEGKDTTKATTEYKYDSEKVGEEIQNWYNDTQSEKYVVTVIASSTCPHCTNYKPIIKEVAENEDVTLYEFDVDTLKQDEQDALQKTYKLENYEGYVPYTYITKDGQFVADFTGEMDSDATVDFLKEHSVIE